MEPDGMIDSEEVRLALIDALFEEDEDTEPNVEVQGVIHQYHLHPERLESHREQVRGWLDQLPDEFRESKGGGWSFLQVCVTKDGEQWTGMHLVCEWLLVLAIGLKLGSWPLPSDFWSVLPGGVPYFVYHDKEDHGQPEHQPA
jgi:hypothetical protein